MALWGPTDGPSQPNDFDENLINDITTSRDFKHANLELVKRVKEFFESYKRMFPARDVIITCTYRSPKVQRQLFAKGRFGNPGPIVTTLDGFNKYSKHNVFPARAIDCAVLEGGKAIWDESVFYPFGKLAQQCELVWGGDWNGNGVKDETFYDYPHVELPKGVV